MEEKLRAFKNIDCFYFGCIDVCGHYLFANNSSKIYSQYGLAGWIQKMDGLLNPRFNPKDGKGLLHHFDGFTVLAFNNQSVDKRPGSNSMFILPGKLTFKNVIKLAHEYFPQVMESLNFMIEIV